MTTPGRPPTHPLELSAEAARTIRAEIERAGGREVCFLADVDEARRVVRPRAVARGNHEAVLAAARDAPQGSVMVHNHPSGLLEPSEADLAVAVRLFQEGLGSALVDNAATRLYVVVEPPEPRIVEPLDLEELEAVLAPGGPLADLHPAFEDRPGQREMLRVVAERYNEGGVALVEAGTGTGKSLAYLLPAAAWALKNDERTVVATATLNLQDQLVAKDLPLVRALLGDEVDFALVKGRGNYVSIRRAHLAATQQGELFAEDRSGELQAILQWLDTTEDGSLGDLPFRPAEDVWEEVQSDSDVCLRARCPHFQECFFQRSRRRAASARVLVANHHLLFTDVAVRQASGNHTSTAVLPPYRHLILDEAHHVEDAATSHLGVEVTRRGLYRTLGRLDRRGRGVLAAVQEALAPLGEGTALELRRRIETSVRPAVDVARAVLDGLQDALEGHLPPEAQGALRIGTPELPEPAADPRVEERLDEALARLLDLEREVARLRLTIDDHEAMAEAVGGRLLDLGAVERRLQGARTALRTVLQPEDGGRGLVRWIERRGRPRGRAAARNLALAAAPIELGERLREALFGRLDTVVLCSATLTTQGTFDFVRGRI
ncbi:MAG: helicase, partial [Gemmatimonadetes bacterium]